MESLRFDFDPNKALQVVLWFLSKHGGELDRMKLLKLIFFADFAFIENYGTAITGGDYVNMKQGPVHSQIYDEFKSPKLFKGRIAEGTGFNIVQKSPVNESVLSQAELETMDSVNSKYGNLDSMSLSKITHNLHLYKDYAPNDGRKAVPIPYEAFYNDNDLLSVAKEYQRAWSFLTNGHIAGQHPK